MSVPASELTRLARKAWPHSSVVRIEHVGPVSRVVCGVTDVFTLLTVDSERFHAMMLVASGEVDSRAVVALSRGGR